MNLLRLFLICLLTTQPAWAEIYRYVDENGKVHFTDSPPENAKTEKLEIEQPVKHGTPAVNKRAAKKLFEKDKVDLEMQRQKRIKGAQERAKKRAAKQQACDKARSDLARMKQNRASAKSINSKRYYNKRIEIAKDTEDESCKLSNFR